MTPQAAESREDNLVQPKAVPATPATLDWARQLFTDDEVAEALRDVRENGGLELHEFLHELVDIGDK